MPFNHEKFQRMLERRNAMRAHERDLAERQREARRRLGVLQGEETKWRKAHGSAPLPKQLDIELREVHMEIEKLDFAYEKAAQDWQECGVTVQRCENFLRDHGVSVSDQTVFVRG